MRFRMGGQGRCDMSNHPNYFRLADKLQNILLGILKPRRGGTQVSPELSKGRGWCEGWRVEGWPQGGTPSSQGSGSTEWPPGSRRMILAPP